MAKKKVGLWLIGACGGVGTTAALGLAAIRNKLSDTTSLVTELPLFETLKLDALDSFVVGGHEIRKGSFMETAKELHLKAKIFDAAMLAGSEKDLTEWSKNIKPGSAVESGSTIAKMADLEKANTKETPRQTIERIQSDLKNFQKANDLEHVVVMSVASTEPPFQTGVQHETLKAMNAALDAGENVLPTSSMYAWACLLYTSDAAEA